MPKLIIDDKEVEVSDGLTILQACKEIGIEVPHFCFHQKLKIAGNCRMCLVEVEKAPKLVASCALNVADGMKVTTQSQKVQDARKGVMEFLLINHPLDCPICDQGGECDLQDQAFKYGQNFSRFAENKRSVKEKNLGPLIKTAMNRCIHCTRCVRFATDIAGVPEMGAVGRGEDMEIASYLNQAITSELSGNMIDLCPVGALTSKPYAFKARSWELEKTESIDVMDGVGSNIVIGSRGMEVMRILPKQNDQINEDWISDKARFSYDGLGVQRLDRCYVKNAGQLQPASWLIALEKTAQYFSKAKDKIAVIAGPMVSCEPMFLLKKLFSQLGSKAVDANQQGYRFDVSSRGNYLFNSSIAGIENADLCLFIGADIRQNAAVLNARIGRKVREGTLEVAAIGEIQDQTYPIEHLGNNSAILEEIAGGKNPYSKKLASAKRPMIIVGEGVYAQENSAEIFANIYQLIDKYSIINPDWNGYNVLHNHANSVGALDLGFYYSDCGSGVQKILDGTNNGEVKLLYLLSADDIDMSKIGKDCIVIYQGHHGGKGAERADIILPEAAYTEQDGIYVNLEGRPQYSRKAVQAPGEAKASIDVIFELADLLGQKLGVSDLYSLRAEMAEQNEVFAHIGEIIPASCKNEHKKSKKSQEIEIRLAKKNYYMDNIICDYSQTMAKCVAEICSINETQKGE